MKKGYLRFTFGEVVVGQRSSTNIKHNEMRTEESDLIEIQGKIHSVEENDTINEKWPCRLHNGNKNDCYMIYERSIYYHIIPVRKMDHIMACENKRNEEGKFSESFGEHNFDSPIAGTSFVRSKTFMESVFKLFDEMDEHKLTYKKNNSSDDFVNKHLIVDARGRLTLCNRHLIKKHNRKNALFSTPMWRRKVLKSLYPGYSHSRKEVPSDVPKWILNYALNDVEK